MEAHNGAVEDHSAALEVRLLVADPHHFDKEPNPDTHQSECSVPVKNLSREPWRIRMVPRGFTVQLGRVL